MPKSLERKRGGVLRWRTIDIGEGKYVHVAITRKKGPRGGRTIAGPIHKLKRKKR